MYREFRRKSSWAKATAVRVVSRSPCRIYVYLMSSGGTKSEAAELVRECLPHVCYN